MNTLLVINEQTEIQDFLHRQVMFLQTAPQAPTRANVEVFEAAVPQIPLDGKILSNSPKGIYQFFL